MRIAIVGSGISGLVAARALHREHDLTVFERHDYPGGHAHTVEVTDGDRTVGLDTGFIVYNEQNYPRFSALLKELEVATQPSEMSLAVGCRRCGIEYSSRGLRGLFARPVQALDPRFHRMVIDIVRFNRWAQREARRNRAGALTLGQLERRGGYGPELFRHYLKPMTGAIWSSTGQDVDAMPLSFVLSFYHQHGLLRTHGHPAWRTVTGGSQRYVEALVRPFRRALRLGWPVRAVRRRPGAVEIRTDAGWEAFDEVVMATHTDQALAVLEDPTPEEQAALAAIRYRRNEVVLHTDDGVVASAPAARASWNCHVDDCTRSSGALHMTYSLNRLQQLSGPTSYYVTLNDPGRVAPEQVLTRMTYAHPIYTREGLPAQQELRRLSGQRHTFYCGAYFGNGFHEDGVRAGMEVARELGARQAAA